MVVKIGISLIRTVLKNKSASLGAYIGSRGISTISLTTGVDF
jgi:hypothetical protein